MSKPPLLQAPSTLPSMSSLLAPRWAVLDTTTTRAEGASGFMEVAVMINADNDSGYIIYNYII